MSADIEKKHKGFDFKTDMKVTLLIIAGSILLFIALLFAGYLIDLH